MVHNNWDNGGSDSDSDDNDNDKNINNTKYFKKWNEETIRNNFFIGKNAMMYELSVLSSIVILRNSYDKIH